MRKVTRLYNRFVVSLMAFGAVVFSPAWVFAVVTTVADPAKLTATNIPTATAISNVTLVGIAMIGVVIAKYGIKAAKSMIS